MTNIRVWDKHKVVGLLSTDNRAVERAMVALYHRQTQDEKSTSTTKHSNGKGFSAAHSNLGSYYARWVLGGRRLTGRHLSRARMMAIYYAGQLAEIANLTEQYRARVRA